MGLFLIIEMEIKITKQTTLASTIAIALSFAAVLMSLSHLTNTIAQPASAQQVFEATNLTGSKEVPPVRSAASGSATFTNNQTVIVYDLAVSDLYNATAAHIHQGRAGANGPIVVTLYTTADPSSGLFGGYSGNITSSMLEGPLKGKQLSALVDLMSKGQAYVNVHTTKNKNGEIRDQVAVSTGEATGLQ